MGTALHYKNFLEQDTGQNKNTQWIKNQKQEPQDLNQVNDNQTNSMPANHFQDPHTHQEI